MTFKIVTGMAYIWRRGPFRWKHTTGRRLIATLEVCKQGVLLSSHPFNSSWFGNRISFESLGMYVDYEAILITTTGLLFFHPSVWFITCLKPKFAITCPVSTS